MISLLFFMYPVIGLNSPMFPLEVMFIVFGILPTKILWKYVGNDKKNHRIQYRVGKTPVEILLPGQGKVTGPDCLTVKERRQCVKLPNKKSVTYIRDKDHALGLVMKTCGKILCPKCWPAKIREKSRDVVGRIFQVWGDGGLPVFHTMPRHFSITPPSPTGSQDDKFKTLGHVVFQMAKTEEGLNRLYDIVKRMLQEAGINAYMITFHPYRVKDKELRALNDSLPASKKMDLYRDGSDLEFYPHFHIFGTGFIDHAEDFMKRYGWQYHNHDAGANERHWLATVRYELGHAGLVRSERSQKFKDLYRWGGYFSRYCLDHEDVEREEVGKCQCGQDMVTLKPCCLFHGDPVAVVSHALHVREEEKMVTKVMTYFGTDGRTAREIDLWAHPETFIRKFKVRLWSLKSDLKVKLNYKSGDEWVQRTMKFRDYYLSGLYKGVRESAMEVLRWLDGDHHLNDTMTDLQASDHIKDLLGDLWGARECHGDLVLFPLIPVEGSRSLVRVKGIRKSDIRMTELMEKVKDPVFQKDMEILIKRGSRIA